VLKPMFVLLALLLSTLSLQQPAAPPAPTAAPTDVAGQVNPVKPTAVSQAFAKKMYGYDCAMCHGANGNGKGDLAVEQKLSLKDYTDPAALKDMSDGELFSIIKNGKGQMTAEGDRLKSDDVWNMVILVRSFAKR
jgi:mono/diheme cytochrome c family protein